jgi:hypothetical protein
VSSREAIVNAQTAQRPSLLLIGLTGVAMVGAVLFWVLVAMPVLLASVRALRRGARLFLAAAL